MENLKYYAKLYYMFLTTSFSKAISFRTSFILVFLLDIFFVFSGYFTIDFIFLDRTNIGIWNRDQFMFFIFFVYSLDQLHTFAFSPNFWMLSYFINTGELDFVLLKPASSMFSCFMREQRPTGIVTTVICLCFLYYFAQKLQLGFFSYLTIPIFLILGTTLLVLIEICLSTAMFWLIEGTGVNFIRLQFQTLSRWPDFVYQGYSRKFFTYFVPLLLVGSAPVNILLGQSILFYSFSLVSFIIVLIFASRTLWNYSLNNYNSASS